jgi:prepilin-type N-terminal cleavage/methylation domain-containing protein
MNTCPICQKKGFTLLELMIALSVLMVVLLCSANMLIVSIQWNTLSMEKSIAARLANNKIDELRGDGYNQVGLKIDSHADRNNPLNADETSGGIYTRTWLVSNGKTPGTKEVRVFVTWHRGQVVLNSLIADQGG